jgi:hypothetical protein
MSSTLNIKRKRYRKKAATMTDQNQHADHIAEKVGHLPEASSDLSSDVITSTATRGSEGERQGTGEGASTARGRSAERAVYDDEQPDDRHCTFVKADGSRCRGWATKDGSGLCSGHAGKGLAANPQAASRLSHGLSPRLPDETAGQRREAQEGLGQGTGAAARGKRTPMDLLRAKMEADPETVAELAWRAMKEGRDVRAITAMLDRTYGEEAGHVEEPHTFDELAKLSREQRRALMTQLEREGRGSPFRMPEH